MNPIVKIESQPLQLIEKSEPQIVSHSMAHCLALVAAHHPEKPAQNRKAQDQRRARAKRMGCRNKRRFMTDQVMCPVDCRAQKPREQQADAGRPQCGNRRHRQTPWIFRGEHQYPAQDARHRAKIDDLLRAQFRKGNGILGGVERRIGGMKRRIQFILGCLGQARIIAAMSPAVSLLGDPQSDLLQPLGPETFKSRGSHKFHGRQAPSADLRAFAFYDFPGEL